LYPGDIMHYPTPLGPYPIGNAKAHSQSIQRCLDFEPEVLLEGHGLSAYSRASSRRRLLHMQAQQRDTRARVLSCLLRAGRPMTIGDLLPEVMPIKTELDYPVSTGIGDRRCYAEACIQTHLVWLADEGKVERVSEANKICFVATQSESEFSQPRQMK
jgi:hypothetical protein